jgi:hypothetical protein
MLRCELYIIIIIIIIIIINVLHLPLVYGF